MKTQLQLPTENSNKTLTKGFATQGIQLKTLDSLHSQQRCRRRGQEGYLLLRYSRFQVHVLWIQASCGPHCVEIQIHILKP